MELQARSRTAVCSALPARSLTDFLLECPSPGGPKANWPPLRAGGLCRRADCVGRKESLARSRAKLQGTAGSQKQGRRLFVALRAIDDRATAMYRATRRFAQVGSKDHGTGPFHIAVSCGLSCPAQSRLLFLA